MAQRKERGRNGRVNPGWFKKGYDARRPNPNPGWFQKGFDRRRHLFTHDERARGGLTTSRKFLVIGRWRPDWWQRCRKRKKEDYDGEKDLYQDEQPATRWSDDIPF